VVSPHHHKKQIARTAAGLLFDGGDHLMRATHATKNEVRYRYYVPQPYLQGIATLPPGAITRVPAADIEATIVSAIKVHLRSAPGLTKMQSPNDHEVIASSVSYIEIRKD
jgi:site-specific DNA recombinase